MELSQRIQAKTDNGDTIIDFLVEVMTGDVRDDFKLCHRLAAARLLSNYGCSCRGSANAGRNQAIDFILNNLPEPSQDRSTARSSDDSELDQALAKKIQEATDDGATVCRFLINVMEGELKAFKPHHRIAAARELLSRGFDPRRSGEEPAPDLIRGRNPEEIAVGGSHNSLTNRPPLPAGEGWGEGENSEHQPTNSHKSPNLTNQSNVTPYSDTGSDIPEYDEDPAAYRARWDKIWEEVTPIIEEGKRISAQQQPDPDNPPYKSDMSVFEEAWENSEKWFQEWKNSLDPEEFQAIVKEGAERFDAKIDARVERRKQIKKDRERREKEEAEREAEQAKARAEAKAKEDEESAAAKELEDLGPPPAREDHERWSPTPSIPTSFRLVNCGHPKCKLHDGPVYYPEDDKSSPYYWDGQQPSWFGANRF